MNGLSFGVIRVNTEDKNSALTVQDVGHVMPEGKNGQEACVRRFWGCFRSRTGQCSLPYQPRCGAGGAAPDSVISVTIKCVSSHTGQSLGAALTKPDLS